MVVGGSSTAFDEELRVFGFVAVAVEAGLLIFYPVIITSFFEFWSRLFT